MLEDSLAEEVLSSRIGEGDTIVIDADENGKALILKSGAQNANEQLVSS